MRSKINKSTLFSSRLKRNRSDRRQAVSSGESANSSISSLFDAPSPSPQQFFHRATNQRILFYRTNIVHPEHTEFGNLLIAERSSRQTAQSLAIKLNKPERISEALHVFVLCWERDLLAKALPESRHRNGDREDFSIPQEIEIHQHHISIVGVDNDLLERFKLLMSLVPDNKNNQSKLERYALYEIRQEEEKDLALILAGLARDERQVSPRK